MKKIYLKPEMDIVEINVNQQVLTTSSPTLGGDYDGTDPVLAPMMGIDDDRIAF